MVFDVKSQLVYKRSSVLSCLSSTEKIRKIWCVDSSKIQSNVLVRENDRFAWNPPLKGGGGVWLGWWGWGDWWVKVRQRRLNQHLVFLSDPSLFYALSSMSWKTVYLWIIYLRLKILNLWCPCPVSYLQGYHKKLKKRIHKTMKGS